MAARPIDIARKLKVSTTTLRKYEELGMIPPVSRSASDYRIYTDAHIAYFVCIREMQSAFSLTHITKILKQVIANQIDAALWMANKAQADLHQEKIISEKMVLNLLHKSDTLINPAASFTRKLLTIHEVSRATGIPASTIRYWDKVGLISVTRSRENNYRVFTVHHIQQILTIYGLRFSIFPDTHRFSVERIKEELQEFDYNDTDRIAAIAHDLKQHLAKLNRLQIKAINALYHLCVQVETNHFV